MKRDRSVYCTHGPQQLLPTGQGELSQLTFVFKDLFDVAGYNTGAGNPDWLASHDIADSTSPLLSCLLSEGATCIGRVQTDELAYSLNGQNIHYGTPVNPLAPDCLPGGSSSGSAVAVARGDADFALGTDTGGSVRVPASYCGLYGLRPSLNHLTLESAFELAKSFDTAGVLARDLNVLRKVYRVLSGTEGNQCAHALVLPTISQQPQYASRIHAVIGLAESAGMSVMPLTSDEVTTDLTRFSELFRIIQGYEIIERHGGWLSQYGHSLDPAIAERVEWARSISGFQYQRAVEQQKIFRHTWLKLLTIQDEVAIIPTTPSGPPKLDTPAEDLAEYRSQLMGLTAIAGLSGCPQLHVPLKHHPESPVGFSLIGKPGSELKLINTALAMKDKGDRT